MAARLKGVILSVEDVIVNKGTINKKVFEQADLLMKFFRIRGIIPVLLANSNWTVTTEKERTKKDLFDVLKRHYPDLKIFSRHFDKKIPPKPRAEATQYVCNMMGWKKNETLYIGSTENDMRTAVNGNLLFLCGTWYNDNINYGFKFSEQKQMARFIDTLCLREHFWSHEIHEDNIQFYALAPFSTMRPDYARYSDDAKRAAKHGLGHPDFWLSALVTSLYFTGIHEKIDFIASYPGHKAGVGNDKMNNDLMTFAKCFRKGYLHNLIERHTTALKSQTSRNQGIQLNHLNQLNTIKLNRLPTKNYSSVYKCNPLKR
ncbi:MAG: HAD family hydrolase, partial [Candidatus Cloacimonetes bacterium]|nr:HAD family hydrolase [Candidatus Cloacimonadota bacterium]MDY0230809.1 HAD family hydrolase [Candidatus Cloacimonadaceae bacterium]